MRSMDVMWEWPCKESPVDGIAGAYCVFGAPWQTARRKTMIWGDSHAEHFAPIFDAVNADPERSFVVFAGCSAVLGDGYYIISVGALNFLSGPERFLLCQRH